MILTGKAKEDFINWEDKGTEACGLDIYQLPNCGLNALIIEWFDSVGIICLIGYNSMIKKYYYNIDKLIYGTNPVKTRQQATEEAIKKANEIYNKN